MSYEALREVGPTHNPHVFSELQMASLSHRHHVYMIRSIRNPQFTYIGITDNLERRIMDHNAGNGGAYTSRHRPWEVVTVISVNSREKARALETYLKSGSGHAFAQKRLW